MCLAIPMQLIERREFDGTADLNGVRRNVALMLTPDATLGDWVLVHAGYAITVVDSQEAARTLALLEAIDVELFEEMR
ncbi:MAG: HypC/HybG/HupF family hydrogenase formation chaperone [Planctomycetota bacterium]